MLLLQLLQSRRRKIAPAELRYEMTPDLAVVVIQLPPFLEAPLQNFFVDSAGQHALAQLGIIYSKEADASFIESLAQVRMVILG